MDQFVSFINASEMPFAKVKEALEEKLPEIEPNDLSGKVAIVTGANVGIGYETAKSLASMKAKKIILACRSIEKANTAILKIKAETHYTGELEAWKLDLSSLKSVEEFSKKFLESKLPLDILVSNAGVAGGAWAETADGLEVTQQVNHLANVLLISNLYPALKQAAENNKEERKNKFPRVVVVASDVHFWSAIQPDDAHPVQTALKKSENWNPLLSYSASKLFNVLFVQAWARKCPEHLVWISSASPGYTDSQLGTKDSVTGEANNAERHNLLPMRQTYEGAKTIIHAAISPKVGESGKYYSEVRESHTRTSTTGEVGVKFSEALWDDTIAILKKYVPYTPIYDWK